MELIGTDVQTVATANLPWGEINVVPIGDIQYKDPKAIDLDRLRATIAWGEASDARYLGMGDYIDFASPSNRDELARGKFYDTVHDALELHAEMMLEELQEILEPTRGKWLGLLEGHHFYEFASGVTSDQKLCEYLKAPFLGTCAMVQVRFQTPKSKPSRKGKPKVATAHKSPAFVIWAHHGRGGGRLLANPINQLENIAKSFEGVDVFLIGHHHKRVGGMMQRITPYFDRKNGGFIRDRDMILACTGSYLKGYLVGSEANGRKGGTYVEKAMLNPVALGGIVIKAIPVNNTGYTRVDLTLEI